MIVAVVDRLSLRLVPDELWALAEPLIPVFEPRPHRSGGRSCGVHRERVRADQRVCVAGSATIVRGAFQTAHCRFGQWTKAGLWRQWHYALLDELGSRGLIDWKPRDRGWRLRAGQKGDP
jgi:hypothetical protein